jgi:hypothetical protein
MENEEQVHGATRLGRSEEAKHVKTKPAGDFVGKEKALLLRVARTIGSTLGTVAAKVNAAPKLGRRRGLSSKPKAKERKIPRQRAGGHHGKRSTGHARKARLRSKR